MGIGQFRREVQRWLNGSLFSAQQDAESASRMPTDVDPVGTVDGRVVDAVEESLLESGKGKGKGRAIYDIQPQAPLTDSEMSAMYGLGHRLIRRSLRGGQEITNRPLAHVRPDHARSSESAPEAATVAEQVIGIVQEPPTCRICMEPESEVDGPLRRFGAACDHVFHTHCIMRWAQTRNQASQACPVCRQNLTDEALGTDPATPPPTTPLQLATALYRRTIDNVTGDAFQVGPDFVSGDAFALDTLRRSTIEEHVSFINELELVDRLPTPVDGPGSELLRSEEAACFAARWFLNRQIDIGDYFDNFNMALTRNEDDNMATYWIEFRLAESTRVIPTEHTASWETAFHGSNMSVLYSIMQRRFLDTGPRGKMSNRHGHSYQYGVYCHKHGTRKKAANYMIYFEYQGFIAAPLLQLKVRDDYIACGDQWCCDPSGVQIESVWIHIVPIRSVGLNRYYIVASPWQSSYELCPISGPARPRYSLAGRPER